MSRRAIPRQPRVFAILLLISAAIACPASLHPTAQGAEADTGGAATDASVDRARQTVKMLDDVYKTAVVLITDKYVHDEDDFPAGSAAVAWFDAINAKGWHEVRLLDATGDPYDEKNTARDDFDRQAIKHLKGGQTFYEEVQETKGQRVLRAATPVPVVMKKCVMCHAHYAEAGEGEPIGILSYSMPID